MTITTNYDFKVSTCLATKMDSQEIKSTCSEKGLITEGLKVDLGGDKWLRVTEWQGEQRIDIRKLTSYPTKEGVSLTLQRYLVFRDCMCDINRALETLQKGEEVRMRRHLGGNVYMRVNSPYTGVDIRQWFIPKDLEKSNDNLRPGKGVFLNIPQWRVLCNEDIHMEDYVPALNDTLRCRDQKDHQNLMGALWCLECNPNRYDIDY